MPNTESLVFDLLVRDRASGGLGDIGKAADGASRNTDALTRRLNELSRKSVEARVRLAGDKDALASLDKMDARLISLDRKVASPNMRVEGAARAIAEISAVDLEMDKLGGKGGSAEEATSRLDQLMAKMGPGGLSGPSGMGALIAGGVALSPVIATLGLGLGGLGVAALPVIKNTREMNAVFGPLKGEVSAFQAELKPEVLALFGQGAGIAVAALKELEPVAAVTGKGLSGVLGDVGKEMRSGDWQQFFGFMRAQAGPDLQLVDKLLIDLLKDVPPLLTQLQPLGRVVLILADDALKLVGGLERMHLVLPLVGAAIGFMVSGGNPLGALAGGLAGVALQAASVNTQLSRTGQEIQRLDKLKPVTKDMVGFAAVAGEVALNLGRQPGALQAVQIAMATAHPVVGTLIGDIATLNATVGSGNSVLAAYSDLWNTFVGKSVSYQQAVLNIKAAFEGYDSAVKSSGRTSTAAQQAFLSIFTTMDSGLQTLQKQRASVGQVNDFYATNIARLNALHGLTPAQRQDIAGLTKDYIAWASSADRLNRNVVNAAHGLGQDMLMQVSAAHRLVPLARSDTDALANSILKTGTNSAATRADRATLIADLRQSGLSAHDATALVDGLQRKIDAMHGKTVAVDVTATGSGGISVGATGLASRIFKLSHLATGGRLPGFGGGDRNLALLEDGEAVVDKHRTRQYAPVLKAMGVPGFSAGGVAGLPPWVAGQEGSVLGGWAGADLRSMLNAMITQASGFLGAGSGNYAADIQAVLRAMGLPLSLTANWLRQIQTESGGNLNAVNLTDSNAAAGHPSVGLLQLIPGTFHAYAGPYVNTPPLVNYGGGTVSENPMAQIYAAIHYAAARYGGAAMAGVIGQGHGYALGTDNAAPGWAWVGEQGPELIRFHGGEQVRPAGNTYHVTLNVPPGTNMAEAGRVFVAAIQQFEKRSGKGWRS